jgi:4-hydroxy-tetrahydrodipicolinate synthase
VIESAGMMAEAGADGIMVEPPYIVTTSTDAEICDRFERIADRSPVPVMMYNNPRRTQISLKPEIVSQLAKHENIVAIKEATRDFAELTLKIELAAENIKIFVGPSPFILPGVMFGAHGFISSGPMELLRQDGARLFELAAAKDVNAALPLHFTVTKLYRALFGLGTWPAALKAAMNMLGRPVGQPRLPVHPLGSPETARLKETLRNVGVLS